MQAFLDKHLTKRVIVNCDREPYLHRWYLFRGERLGVFIHKFVKSDEDRALHDHPWSFLVIPVWRGYIEHSEKEKECPHCEDSDMFRESCELCGRTGKVIIRKTKRVLPILGTRLRPATYRHRVELLQGRLHHREMDLGLKDELPAWSIFIRFRKVRDWGFWPKEGFVQWNKWWNDKCE